MGQWDRVVAVLAWLLCSGFLLWQATVSPTLQWQDSTVYERVAAAPLWSRAFWLGARPPVTPFLWKLTGTPLRFVVVQTVVAAGAWGALALVAGRLVPRPWPRLATRLGVLAFATTLPVALWNRSVLSESLALSGVALLFAAVLLLAERPTLPRVAALVAVVLFCALTRDSSIWLAVVLAAVAVYVLCRRAYRGWRPLAVAATVGLVAVAGFTLAGLNRSGRSHENIDNVYVARVFPYPARVAWFGAHGMPDEAVLEQLAESARPSTPGTAPVVGPDLSLPMFASLNRWMATRAGRTYALWVVTHPWFLVSEPLRRPERAYNFAQGDLSFYAGANRTTSGLSPVLWPPWPWLFVIGGAAVLVAGLRRRWHDRTLVATCVLAALGIPLMIAAWQSDGQEVTRHTIEGLTQLRLGLWLALVLAAGRRGMPGGRPERDVAVEAPADDVAEPVRREEEPLPG